jgi:hypothetical protein
MQCPEALSPNFKRNEVLLFTAGAGGNGRWQQGGGALIYG